VPDLLERLRSGPRVTVRRDGPPNSDGHCVVYWMQRSQRTLDNPALDAAVTAANLLGKPIVVFFAPIPFYPHGNLRHYAFLEQGIADIAQGCRERNIGFVLRRWADHRLPQFCEEVAAALVVGDENPLRETEDWRQRASKLLRVPFWTVDSDVIVPTRLLLKEQYAAYTIRPRIHAELARFLQPCGNPRAHVTWNPPKGLQSLEVGTSITIDWPLDRSVQPVTTFRGGTREGLRLLDDFVKRKLSHYDRDRNHPELNGTSLLSPYLHFGHLGPYTVALAVKKAKVPNADRDAYLEQLIVRRELAINFVRFNPNYDNVEAAEPWAGQTLRQHARDPRPVTYTEAQLVNAESHDPLWNAAQRQMVETGWMHNYMRMYWAKKILEWTPSAAVAFQLAVRLNDRYFLDGRDPDGYAGIAWSIVGKHDRAWPERPIFGKIRSMTYQSIHRKFDSKSYIARFSNGLLFENAI
jgi:deoxyribodipyrimidine photo-lyase